MGNTRTFMDLWRPLLAAVLFAVPLLEAPGVSADDAISLTNQKKEADHSAVETVKVKETVDDPREGAGNIGKPVPRDARSYLLKGATVITLDEAGTLTRGDVLIEDGLITGVGADLTVPEDAVILDLRGMFVTPGLIDAHSHTATMGQVNEATNAVTAEVRISDILDPDSISLYRQLAGGLTTAHILHGSANPIGGQSAVIKLRYGVASGERLLFKEAPPTIKFALGENVKQSNWGDPEANRYPKSRMGVMQTIGEAFVRAKEYRRKWQAFSERQRQGERNLLPPRRDLQLEALVEVLEGKRKVHCHSYRSDEILAMIRLAEEMGFKIQVFQHALEAYRVADEIAAHGAGVSTFSDWWTYKMEVYEAIPYNAALCWERGAVVTLNSDSAELARRLNTEAAKAVKYGGVPEEEALKMVTLNAAIQLGVERWVGSIRVGKQADLAVWSHHPLSSYAICQKTFVDGNLRFDIDRDRRERKEIAKEKKELAKLEKERAKKSSEKEKKEESGEKKGKKEEAPEPGKATDPEEADEIGPIPGPDKGRLPAKPGETKQPSKPDESAPAPTQDESEQPGKTGEADCGPSDRVATQPDRSREAGPAPEQNEGEQRLTAPEQNEGEPEASPHFQAERGFGGSLTG